MALNLILLISASQIARITAVSHQHPVEELHCNSPARNVGEVCSYWTPYTATVRQ
jgi:hypothetical protein